MQTSIVHFRDCVRGSVRACRRRELGRVGAEGRRGIVPGPGHSFLVGTEQEGKMCKVAWLIGVIAIRGRSGKYNESGSDCVVVVEVTSGENETAS